MVEYMFFNAKSSAASLFSTLRATRKAIRLSYIVEIAGHRIFSKSEVSTALAKLNNAGMSQVHIKFAVEPTLTAKQKWYNSNELALFVPNTKWSGSELPTNDLHVAKLETKSRAKSRVKSSTKSRSKSSTKSGTKSRTKA